MPEHFKALSYQWGHMLVLQMLTVYRKDSGNEKRRLYQNSSTMVYPCGHGTLCSLCFKKKIAGFGEG